MTEPIPDDSAQRRTWLIAGVLSIIVVLVGVGVPLLLLQAHPQRSPTRGVDPGRRRRRAGGGDHLERGHASTC